MSSLRLTLVLGAVAGSLSLLAAERPLAAATAPSASPVSAAEKYFGCPTGYSFQVSGSNARCYLAGTTTTADIFCGVGYVKTIDQFSGGRDGCQNKVNNLVGNYTCPSGYSSHVQAGPDYCKRTTNPSIIAPTVEKSI